MPTLHLGVLDIAYSDPDAPGAVTTGEVAEFLEKKYHVMQVFYELHGQEIADKLGQSVAEQMESLLQGNRTGGLENLSVDGIDNMFRRYLDADEWQKISGQTIAAAKAGVSHRKKGKKRKGSRPAFIDTGLYQQSSRAWMTK